MAAQSEVDRYIGEIWNKVAKSAPTVYKIEQTVPSEIALTVAEALTVNIMNDNHLKTQFHQPNVEQGLIVIKRRIKH